MCAIVQNLSFVRKSIFKTGVKDLDDTNILTNKQFVHAPPISLFKSKQKYLKLSCSKVECSMFLFSHFNL